MSRLQQTLDNLKAKIHDKFDAKRIDLIADWLDAWSYYIDQESTFDSKKRRNYAPGDIVSICLGLMLVLSKVVIVLLLLLEEVQEVVEHY